MMNLNYKQTNLKVFMQLSLLGLMLFICFFVGSLSAASVSDNSSLDQRWLTEKLAIAEQKSIENPELAVEYLNKVLKNNKQNLTPLQRSQLQISLAENYIFNIQVKKADALRRQISSHLEVLGDVSLVKYLIIESKVYGFKGENEKALASLLQAEQKIPSLNDTKTKGLIYSALADFFLDNENETRAIDYFYKAYEQASISGNKLDLAYIESQMADSFTALYDYEKAITLQKNALAYFSKHNLTFDMIVSNYHLAEIYLKISQSKKAIKSADNILKINKNSSTPQFNYYAYIVMTQGYYQLGDIDKAQKYLTLSNQLLAKIEGINKLIEHLLIQAKVEIAQNFTKDAKKSIAKLQHLLADISVQSSVSYRLELLAVQAQYAINQGDFEQATAYQQSYIDLNKQYNVQVKELFRSRHKVQFEIRKIELENQLLEKDKALKDYEFIKIKQEQALNHTIIFSVLMLLLVILIFAWRQYRLKRKFNDLANTDSLTEVANRRKVMDFAEQHWLKHKENDNNFSLIGFDLDHFKHVNDTYGHPTGDLVLKSVVKLAQQVIREQDFLGRIGGEEFLVVLTNTIKEDAIDIANRIKSVIEAEEIHCDGQIIRVTVSLGVTQKSKQTDTLKTLLKQVDNALYAAKENGRNRVEIYE